MANLVKHRFASGKTDGPDASQVQPSHWNDGHAFAGGNAGDILTRDPTDATYGASWSTGMQITQMAAGGTASLPSGPRAHLVVINSATADAIYGAAPTTGAFTIGTRLTFLNLGTGNFVLVQNSTTAPAGRFVNFAIGQFATQLRGQDGAGGGSASYIWDGNFWRMTAHEQGGPLTLAFSAANFVGCVPTTLYLDTFYLHGRDAHVSVNVAVNVPAIVGTLKLVNWPWTFAPMTGAIFPVMNVGSPTHAGWGPDFAAVTGTSIDLYLSTSASWAAGSYNISLDLTIPIL